MNARLDIKIGVQIQTRLNGERFRPTSVRNSSFAWVTDLDSYTGILATAANAVYAEVQAARLAGSVTETHVAIRLDNPTHPVAALGVVPLAKGHVDVQLCDGDFPDASALQTVLHDIVNSLKSTSKY